MDGLFVTYLDLVHEELGRHDLPLLRPQVAVGPQNAIAKHGR